MILLTACSTWSPGNTTDSALCTELKVPIDNAVDTLIEYKNTTPPPVINDWTVVTRGFDVACK